MNTERRPRIKPDIAADVIKKHPLVPFERMVNSLLEDALHYQSMTTREAVEFIAVEHLNMDLKAFKALCDSVYDELTANLDEYAFMDEHTDPDSGVMDHEAFNRAYPTEADKKGYFRRQADAGVKLNPRDFGHDFDLEDC